MSLAIKIDAARVRRAENPNAIRLVRDHGREVRETHEDDTVVIRGNVWPVAEEPVVVPFEPRRDRRTGFFRRLATLGNKTFAAAFIVIAFTGSNVASYATGDADRQIMETRAKIALMVEADLHPPLVPMDWNRETGETIKAPTTEFDWGAGK